MSLLTALSAALLQAPVRVQEAPPTVVRGLYNWVHSTADAERAFGFNRDVLGIELAPSPFIPGAAALKGIRA